jgi:subtilisin-like proprotein convertase family protein
MAFKKTLLRGLAVSVIALSALPAFGVIGGSEVPSGWYPYTTAVLGKTTAEIGCTGTLVAPRWVVTAAHCVAGPRYGFNVRVGSVKWQSGGVVIAVTRRIVHPNYKPPSQVDDIAMLELATAVPSATASPAPMSGGWPPVGASVRSLGWGATNASVLAPSATLKQLDTTVLRSCAITGPNELCTKSTPTAATCAGDSGGPVLYNGAIAGVMSRGLACGSGEEASANISSYRTWIDQQIASTTPKTYSNNNDYQIPDTFAVESPITVSGRSGNGSASTKVYVDIRHTYIGSLRVDLVAPDGSLYILHNRTGTTTDNIIGTYTVNLSSEALNGTWKLRVNDNRPGDTGYINAWNITF